MDWLYENKTIEESDIPEKSIGFIYLITHRITGKRYLGRKLLTKSHRRQKNNKVIKSRVESDWKDYWSSSPEVKSLVEIEGKENFIREILMFAPNRSQLNYLEEKFLYAVGALESEDWYNSNIRSKMYKTNILNKLDVNAVNILLEKLRNGTKS